MRLLQCSENGRGQSTRSTVLPQPVDRGPSLLALIDRIFVRALQSCARTFCPAENSAVYSRHYFKDPTSFPLVRALPRVSDRRCGVHGTPNQAEASLHIVTRPIFTRPATPADNLSSCKRWPGRAHTAELVSCGVHFLKTNESASAADSSTADPFRTWARREPGWHIASPGPQGAQRAKRK